MALSIFIPVRGGSERVLNKNTRNFSGIEGGLLELKLMQLKAFDLADEIVVSTNDERCWEIALKFKNQINNLKIVERPNELGNSATPLSNLIQHVPDIISNEDILWTHVTSPFCDSKKYTEAIEKYYNVKNSKHDSLISGRIYRDFLLNKKSGCLLNNSTNLPWPRTQDLDDLFEINNAVFIASRRDYLKGNRIGENPYFMDFDKISSIDIDNKEDFTIAEAVYDRIYK